MCGITGIFHFNGSRKIDRELLASMAEELAHRGPDDSGFHLEDNLGLGFRRLSIIDLAGGNQPIYNEDKSVVVVCNGEIFNYKELTQLLQSKGHKFYTSCDVEVLVHLYEEFGTGLFEKLNGQFAFAIYDSKEKQLLLARDHVGICPLFYTVVDDVLIFASEIKAILKHPLAGREINLVGLDQVFSFPAVISPRTIFKDIYSPRPGHYIMVKDGNLQERQYWDLVYPEESEIDYGKPESYYIERLDELLQQSIKYRLIADVPVGFYLSGGVDSSLIAALISRLHPGEQRHSFSVGFTDENIDERKYQRMMSDAVNSIHHETVFDWPDISDRFADMVRHSEFPLKETYDTCLLALSETARNSGIKVVLTGEGSDELFAGYIGYRFDKVRDNRQADPADVEAALESEIREGLWGDPNLLYERNQYEFRETKQAIYSSALCEKFREFDSVTKSLIDKSRLQGRHPMHKRSYLDFKLRLPDHLLSDHGDRVSFANSVEARYPFLDINLIEFVKTIPPTLLVNGSVEKYILKEFSRKYIPEQIVKREKFAFVAPGSPYLIRQEIEWIDDLLSYERIKRQGYFNPNTIERLKKLYKSEKFTLSENLENDLLLIVLTFGKLLELFAVPDYN